MYVERYLEKKVRECSRTYPAVTVRGQRQVGKSTMLHHLMGADRRYVTLDDINARHLAEDDLKLFFEAYAPPVLVDEVQRAPGILLEAKRLIDMRMLEGGDAAGMFWFTGSQRFSMMKGAAESLAGRVAVLDLPDLSASEVTGRAAWAFDTRLDAVREHAADSPAVTPDDVYRRIFLGGMPRVALGEIELERYFSDYVDTPTWRGMCAVMRRSASSASSATSSSTSPAHPRQELPRAGRPRPRRAVGARDLPERPAHPPEPRRLALPRQRAVTARKTRNAVHLLFPV